jgi:hypothetical protein
MQTKIKIAFTILSFTLILSIAGCDKNDSTPSIDKTPLLIGEWQMIEMSEPANVEGLTIRFFDDQQFNSEMLTRTGGRSSSVADGTWQWEDDSQQRLIVITSGQKIYAVNRLTETELHLSRESGEFEHFEKK